MGKTILPFEFTLPSSPPVAMYIPSGEYERHCMLLKWPCCFKIKDSLCHSHTTNWPIPTLPSAIQSPVELKATLAINWLDNLQNNIKFNFNSLSEV